jgi:hypothetical protein
MPRGIVQVQIEVTRPIPFRQGQASGVTFLRLDPYRERDADEDHRREAALAQDDRETRPLEGRHPDFVENDFARPRNRLTRSWARNCLMCPRAAMAGSTDTIL